MTREYLKRATGAAAGGEDDVRDTVRAILDEIEAGGEEAVRRLAARFDQCGDIVVSPGAIESAAAEVPERLRDDIRFAHGNIRRFALAQEATVGECQIEVCPG